MNADERRRKQKTHGGGPEKNRDPIALSLRQPHHSGMQFPDRLHVDAPALVGQVDEGEALDVGRDGLGQFALIEQCARGDSMLLQLELKELARGAVFSMGRSFDDRARSILVRSVGDLHVDVAISRVLKGELHKCMRDVKRLKFAAAAGCAIGRNGRLRPGKHGGYRDLLWSDGGNGNMLGIMAEVFRCRCGWRTVADIEARG